MIQLNKIEKEVTKENVYSEATLWSLFFLRSLSSHATDDLLTLEHSDSKKRS